MTHSALILRGVALACAIGAASLPAMAQDAAGTSSMHVGKKGDPARWTRGDATKAQRKATLTKEINAAYAEQQGACKRAAAGQRAGCLKEARQAYRQDLARMPQLLADAPAGGVTERVVATGTGAPDTPAQGGAGAYGGSGAGSTGAGSGAASGAGSVDAIPPNNGQAGGMPPPIDQPNPVQPVQPQQGGTTGNAAANGAAPTQQQ